MAKSFSIKQRKRQPLPPITYDEVRERDAAAQAAFEEFTKADENTKVLKQKWHRARHSFHSAMRRWNEQQNKT